MLRRQWLWEVYFGIGDYNCIRQPARHLARSSHWQLWEHLQGQYKKLSWKYSAFDGSSCQIFVQQLAKICRIMVIIWACFHSSSLVQLVSNTKVNLSQPLPPQLVCNQGNHSVIKTSNTFLQCTYCLSNANSATKLGAHLLHTTTDSFFNQHSTHNVCSPNSDCKCIREKHVFQNVWVNKKI